MKTKEKEVKKIVLFLVVISLSCLCSTCKQKSSNETVVPAQKMVQNEYRQDDIENLASGAEVETIESNSGISEELQEVSENKNSSQDAIEAASKEKDIFAAALNNDLLAVKGFLLNGVSPNRKEPSGGCVLMVAAQEGNLDIVKLLVEKGAVVDCKDNTGWTPLGQAASGGHLDVCKYLVENGANVNAKDKTGWTVLHAAAINGQLEPTKFLIENGARTNVKAGNGWSPLDACRSPMGQTKPQWHEVVKILQEHGGS
ncbi:MAG: ankyrin repeat domain-containing protein [Candidatus Alcyoniella australis]|nr:ankyrin repeat domain-containing protein [Candidatus Alcyoniella australis]